MLKLHLRMQNEKYTREQVVEIAVEALMTYRDLIKRAYSEYRVSFVADNLYEKVTTDIKNEFKFF